MAIDETTWNRVCAVNITSIFHCTEVIAPDSGELVLDPPVTPGGVLLRQAEGERGDSWGDGRPTGSPCG